MNVVIIGSYGRSVRENDQIETNWEDIIQVKGAEGGTKMNYRKKK